MRKTFFIVIAALLYPSASYATEPALVRVESIVNAMNRFCIHRSTKKTAKRKRYANTNSVVVYALDHKTGKGGCSLNRSEEASEKLVARSLKKCKKRIAGTASRCHVLYVNGKLRAPAADFSDLPEKVIRKNELSHKKIAVRRKSKIRMQALSKLSFNELGQRMMAGEVAPAEVFSRHGQSSLKFAFHKPLDFAEIPKFDVVALTKLGFPKPEQQPNPWLYKQQQAAQVQLRKAGSAIMVAPVQTIGYGLDRAHRLAATLLLTREIARQTNQTPYDPVLVGRLFDSGLRAIDVDVLTKTAKNLGAHTLVIPYIGHDNGTQLFMRLKTVRLTARSGSPDLAPVANFEQGRSFNELVGVLEEAKPLFVSYGTHLAQALGVPDAQSTLMAPGDWSANDTSLAPTPALIRARDDETSALRLSYEYQWLAALIPDRATALRHELFARSLVAADAAQADHPMHVRLLKSRALAELGSVPAARQLLQNSNVPAMKAYLAFSKGQLSEMRKYLNQVSDPALRDILRIDLVRLQQAADVSKTLQRRDVALLEHARPLWKTHIRHKLFAHHRGQFETASSLTALLDGPENSGLASAINSFLSKPSSASDNVVAINRVRGLRDLQRGNCAATVQYCPSLAYIDLLESFAVQAAILPIERLVYQQGLYGRGLNYLAKVDTVLKGHTEFEKVVASSYVTIKEKAPDTAAIDSLNRRLKQAHGFLRTGLEFTSNLVFHPNDKSVSRSAYDGYRAAHYQNYPPPHWWVRSLGRGQDPNRKALYKRELDHMFFYLPDPLSASILSEPDIKTEAISRFGEHYRLIRRLSNDLAEERKTPENINALVKFSNQRIVMDPDEWVGYAQLGFALARDRNDYDGAAQSFLTYPAFHDGSPESPLSVDGKAARVGHFYFWRGDMKNARLFYEIVAKLGTGSARYMSAQQRLAQLAGDYDQLLSYAVNRVERYGDEYAMRDLLAWHFVMGNDKPAWETFAATHNIFKYGQPWLAAQVGARRAGFTWTQNMSWLLDPAHNQPVKHGHVFSAVAAAGLALMDRNPGVDQATDIQKLEIQAKLKPRSGRLVPSRLVKGLTALQAGEHASAYETLLAELKRVKGPFFNGFEYGDVLLPYVAYAAARRPELAKTAWQPSNYKVNPPVTASFLHGFEQHLAGKGNFDLELAKAFQTGLSNEHDQAVKHLQTAFNYMPYARTRAVHPAYQWAEACEWLYRDTGKEVYRDMALDWAKRYQKIVPYLAWPYAFEATLSQNKQDQIRATAFVQYLDPNSARLGHLPEALRREAMAADLTMPWH